MQLALGREAHRAMAGVDVPLGGAMWRFWQDWDCWLGCGCDCCCDFDCERDVKDAVGAALVAGSEPATVAVSASAIDDGDAASDADLQLGGRSCCDTMIHKSSTGPELGPMPLQQQQL